MKIQAMKQNLQSNDLHLKLEIAGFNKLITNPSQVNTANIANGKLQFSSTLANISVHTCDIIEKRHFSSTTELDACLSINLLFKGRVSYQLNQAPYTFSTDNNKPLLIVNAINQSELFTRFMTPNQRVKKINITYNKQWLYDHCLLSTDVNLLDELFTTQHKVNHWEANDNLILLANTIMDNVDDQSLHNQLLTERLGIEVLQICLLELKQRFNTSQPRVKKIVNRRLTTNLLEQINVLLDQKLSLDEIANELAMSVSTLQRKFKSQYKVTVIEYHRNRKLNQSRKHLLVDGLSIGETAYIAGYKYTSNFNYAFKQHFKVTPTEFSRQHTKSLT